MYIKGDIVDIPKAFYFAPCLSLSQIYVLLLFAPWYVHSIIIHTHFNYLKCVYQLEQNVFELFSLSMSNSVNKEPQETIFSQSLIMEFQVSDWGKSIEKENADDSLSIAKVTPSCINKTTHSVESQRQCSIYTNKEEESYFSYQCD